MAFGGVCGVREDGHRTGTAPAVPLLPCTSTARARIPPHSRRSRRTRRRRFCATTSSGSLGCSARNLAPEICMSFAFRAGFVPLDFYRFPVISFNIRADEKLPLERAGLNGHHSVRRRMGHPTRSPTISSRRDSPSYGGVRALASWACRGVRGRSVRRYPSAFLYYSRIGIDRGYAYFRIMPR